MSNEKPIYKGYSLSARIDNSSLQLINRFASLIDASILHYGTAMLYEPHITIARDILEEKITQAESMLKHLANRKIIALFDSINVFEVREYDVLAFSLICPDFEAMNKLIIDKLGVVEDYTYQAHITFAFVKKGHGKDVAKNINFESIKNKQIVIDGYCSSNPQGEYKALFEVAA